MSDTDSKLIGLILDDGIFMQTPALLTRSVESVLYKEEGVKFPLIDAEA